MLRDGGGLKITQVPALGPQVQKLTQQLIFVPVRLGLAHRFFHLGNGLLQRRILGFQGLYVFIIGLLIVEPGGNGGICSPERGRQHAGDIHQGRGAEKGHERERRGDDRPGEQDPYPVVFQEIFQGYASKDCK